MNNMGNVEKKCGKEQCGKNVKNHNMESIWKITNKNIGNYNVEN